MAVSTAFSEILIIAVPIFIISTISISDKIAGVFSVIVLTPSVITGIRTITLLITILVVISTVITSHIGSAAILILIIISPLIPVRITRIIIIAIVHSSWSILR